MENSSSGSTTPNQNNPQPRVSQPRPVIRPSQQPQPQQQRLQGEREPMQQDRQRQQGQQHLQRPYHQQGQYQREQYPQQRYYPEDRRYRRKPFKNNLTLVVVITVLAVLAIAVGAWWLLQPRSVEVTPEATQAEGTELAAADNLAGQQQAELESSNASTNDDYSQPGVGSGSEAMSLFNRPLTYTGTVTPGGVASLNVILFQNGRIEGTLDYSGSSSMPVYGSYTWRDNGHIMNVTLTVSSPNNDSYSESWVGTSSFIKENLAHTLSFKQISTSKGESKTASFALRP